MSRDERTRAEDELKKMSGEESTVFSAKTIGSFQVWRKAFKRLIRVGVAAPEFSQALQGGCEMEDLEWALFNVIHWYEQSREGHEQIEVFLAALSKVRSDLSRLETDLKSLVNLPYLSGTYLRACFSYLGSESDEELAVYQVCSAENPRARYEFLASGMEEELATLKFLALLHSWAARFDLIREFGRQPRDGASTSASEAEALLVHYIRKFTNGKCSVKHSSALLSVALEASGIKARKYDLDAFVRRYNRFKRQSPQRVELIDKVLELYSKLESKDRRSKLVNFFYEVQLKLGRQMKTARLGRKDNF
jgi:hypothetical protein